MNLGLEVFALGSVENPASAVVAFQAVARAVVLFGMAAFWQWWTGQWRMRGSLQGSFIVHQAFVGIIWAPLTEELAFRVVLLNKTLIARSHVSSVPAIALSNGVFFAFHHLWNIRTFPFTYVMLQCLVSLFAGSAAALHTLVFGKNAVIHVVAVHMSNNLLAMFYDPSVIAKDGGIFVLLYVLGLIFCNILWIRETKNQASMKI